MVSRHWVIVGCVESKNIHRTSNYGSGFRIFSIEPLKTSNAVSRTPLVLVRAHWNFSFLTMGAILRPWAAEGFLDRSEVGGVTRVVFLYSSLLAQGNGDWDYLLFGSCSRYKSCLRAERFCPRRLSDDFGPPRVLDKSGYLANKMKDALLQIRYSPVVDPQR